MDPTRLALRGAEPCFQGDGGSGSAGATSFTRGRRDRAINLTWRPSKATPAGSEAGRPERDGAGRLLKTCDIPFPSVWDRLGPALHVALILGCSSVTAATYLPPPLVFQGRVA